MTTHAGDAALAGSSRSGPAPLPWGAGPVTFMVRVPSG